MHYGGTHQPRSALSIADRGNGRSGRPRGSRFANWNMNNTLRFVMALVVTILLMLTFRALVFTVYTVSGTTLEPCFADGDRVLVNRWSYGLRTGGGGMFRYARWVGSRIERGDLAVFNNPADTARRISAKKALAYYCTGVPGDTIRIGGARVVVPGKDTPCRVTPANARLLCFLYNRFEGRKASVSGGRLYVDGKETKCATLANDYYWFSSGRASDRSDSRSFGLVPETHVIGKVAMLLYSTDKSKPFTHRLRKDRFLLIIRK